MPLPLRLALKLAMRDASVFSLDMRKYLEAESERAALVAALDAAFEEVDLVLAPVSSTCAFTHRKIGSPIEVDGRLVDYSTATVGLTLPFSVAGNPVLCAPVGAAESGLSVGVQAVAPRYRDFDLLGWASLLGE